MPMYFPDLKSVQRLAEMMTKQPDPKKKYNGLIPKDETDLSEARYQLGLYFRLVWGDTIQAIEVEEGATKENYEEVIQRGVLKQFRGRA